ncbi:PREDICTED: uncharacterized protein LOC106725918 [Myotis brandtii]|uniref:uncharacterized protein LOC106725918 n=1 Tax=Myotis brandtii TaxID=109478 RepID=UPI00070446E6|nr:PREDICTED: uncharacterized protein LOC106725918 [Myotis brandtii]
MLLPGVLILDKDVFHYSNYPDSSDKSLGAGDLQSLKTYSPIPNPHSPVAFSFSRRSNWPAQHCNQQLAKLDFGPPNWGKTVGTTQPGRDPSGPTPPAASDDCESLGLASPLPKNTPHPSAIWGSSRGAGAPIPLPHDPSRLPGRPDPTQLDLPRVSWSSGEGGAALIARDHLSTAPTPISTFRLPRRWERKVTERPLCPLPTSLLPGPPPGLKRRSERYANDKQIGRAWKKGSCNKVDKEKGRGGWPRSFHRGHGKDEARRKAGIRANKKRPHVPPGPSLQRSEGERKRKGSGRPRAPQPRTQKVTRSAPSPALPASPPIATATANPGHQRERKRNKSRASGSLTLRNWGERSAEFHGGSCSETVFQAVFFWFI